MKSFSHFKKQIILITLCLFLTGCVSTLRTSPTYETAVEEIQTIAVMPADVEVYKMTAGGVRELMDTWTSDAKRFINISLKAQLGERHGKQVKFIEEEWLKENYPDLWKANRGLYQAVSLSALMHGFSLEGTQPFPTKLKTFDYTLGEEIQDLKAAVEADALLFIFAFDHEATAGRTGLWLWNFAVGALTGVMVLPTNPSFMSMGLVNGETGALEWYKISPPGMEYSFKSKKHMNSLVEWLTRDFIKTER